MRAAVIHAFGAPQSLVIADLPAPVPSTGQVLLRVEACGVCGHDLLNRRGHFPSTQLPCVMGHEIAGTIVACGSDIRELQVGDRVAVLQRCPCGACRSCLTGRENLCNRGLGFYGEGLSGGYGDFVLATERNSVRIPPDMPAEVAAIMSCAIGTGLHALRRAGLQSGSTVVVTGASGGVGIHTLKLARLQGLRAIAVTASPRKRKQLLQAGAAEVVVAQGGTFHEEVRAMTAGEGADAVIEVTGAPTFESSMRSVRAGGCLVMVGNVAPGRVPLNPAVCILKEIDLIGSAHATCADLRDVLQLVSSGAIVPMIAATLPRDKAADAHSMVERRDEAGRVVLLH